MVAAGPRILARRRAMMNNRAAGHWTRSARGVASPLCPALQVARATRSLPAALYGRDGLVHRLVDAEDLRQPGDLEDLQDPLLRADQVQRAVVSPHPLQAPDQHPEAGGVEEPDLIQVDDELVAAPADQVDEQLPEPRRGIHIDLALHVDDLNAVLGMVTQLQIHTSSSAMPSVISTSIPAPQAGVAGAKAD